MMPSLVWRLLWRLLCGLPYRFVSLLDLQKNECWLSHEMKERMSVSLFNTVSPRGSGGTPAGSIEVLTDENNLPHFKRADLVDIWEYLMLRHHYETQI